MALTRKSLKAMGIDEEKIEQIIDLHLEVVDSLKTERDSYKENAEKYITAQAELDELKSKAPKDDEYKSKYETEHKAFEDYKSSIETEKANTAKAELYKKLLKDNGIADKFVDLILKATDLSNIKVDENGKIEDIESLSKSIKEDYKDFISIVGQKGASVENPLNTSSVMTKEAFEKMSLSEQMKYANEHPNEMTELLKK